METVFRVKIEKFLYFIRLTSGTQEKTQGKTYLPLRLLLEWFDYFWM